MLRGAARPAGTRVEQILRLAEEQANDHRGEAKRESEGHHLRCGARGSRDHRQGAGESAAMKATAEREAGNLRAPPPSGRPRRGTGPGPARGRHAAGRRRARGPSSCAPPPPTSRRAQGDGRARGRDAAGHRRAGDHPAARQGRPRGGGEARRGDQAPHRRPRQARQGLAVPRAGDRRAAGEGRARRVTLATPPPSPRLQKLVTDGESRARAAGGPRQGDRAARQARRVESERSAAETLDKAQEPRRQDRQRGSRRGAPGAQRGPAPSRRRPHSAPAARSTTSPVRRTRSHLAARTDALGLAGIMPSVAPAQGGADTKKAQVRETARRSPPDVRRVAAVVPLLDSFTGSSIARPVMRGVQLRVAGRCV